MGAYVEALFWLLLVSIPLAISLWAFLDAASRPDWVWAMVGRRRLAWMGACFFGVFINVLGLGISGYYLLKIRTRLRAIENGDFSR